MLKGLIAKSPSLFNKDERTAAVLDAAANEALDAVVDELMDGAADRAAAPALAATPSFASKTQGLCAPGSTVPVRQVEGDVLAVLRRCRVDDEGRVYLPAGKLERTLYEKTNAVLTTMGGQWTGSKVQAHVFSRADPALFAQCFAELQATGTYTDPKDLGFFETQPAEARQAIALAGLRPGMRVLEPSAGRAALAGPAADIVGIANVQCVEIFSPNARALQKAGFAVCEQDFLTLEPPEREEDRFDVVVMNPPFGSQQDVAHVSHACRFLKQSGRLVAITSPSWEMRTASKKAEAFRELLLASRADVTPIAAGAFKAAGTMVATRLITLEAKNLPWNCQAQEAEALDDAPQDFALADAP